MVQKKVLRVISQHLASNFEVDGSSSLLAAILERISRSDSLSVPDLLLMTLGIILCHHSR